MTQITIDHSGRPLPSQPQHDDGWDYNPEPRITQAGDEIHSWWGQRWYPVVTVGFHMPDNVRYRRRKVQQ